MTNGHSSTPRKNLRGHYFPLLEETDYQCQFLLINTDIILYRSLYFYRYVYFILPSYLILSTWAELECFPINFECPKGEPWEYHYLVSMNTKTLEDFSLLILRVENGGAKTVCSAFTRNLSWANNSQIWWVLKTTLYDSGTPE